MIYQYIAASWIESVSLPTLQTELINSMNIFKVDIFFF